MKKTLEEYRPGGVGAMMDEYERAAFELKTLIASVSAEDYERIADRETKDEDCRSIRTVMAHVVGAAYGYANKIRETLAVAHTPYEMRQIPHAEVGVELDQALAYTAATLEGKWEMTDEEMDEIVIKMHWADHTLEQLLEHAIVHILRHRRQVEKFLLKFEQ